MNILVSFNKLSGIDLLRSNFNNLWAAFNQKYLHIIEFNYGLFNPCLIEKMQADVKEPF